MALAIVLMLALAVPSLALVEPDPNFTDWITGWTGSGQTSILIGHGVNSTLTVGTNTNLAGDHQWWVTPRGGGYSLQTGSSNYCANIYRVLQGGAYYKCTGYPYENATGGIDQTVDLLQYGTYTIIRLRNAYQGKSWYMMADYSQPTPISDVIWYTDSSAMKARWA